MKVRQFLSKHKLGKGITTYRRLWNSPRHFIKNKIDLSLVCAFRSLTDET